MRTELEALQTTGGGDSVAFFCRGSSHSLPDAI